MSLPTHYYDRDGITIYNADCRDVLPYLEPGSIDLVLTDPPYGVRYVTAWRSRNDPLVAAIEGDESLDSLRAVMDDVERLLANDRHAYFFASAMKVGETQEIVSESLTVKNVLIWDKGDAGSVGDLEAGYGVNWEALIYASKGRRTFNGPRPRALFRHDWSGTRDPVHPTVKPVGILQRFVERSSCAGETILDPFMGSGTTLRAAKDLGRRAIGIELEERYCEIAVKRLQQSVLPGMEAA